MSSPTASASSQSSSSPATAAQSSGTEATADLTTPTGFAGDSTSTVRAKVSQGAGENTEFRVEEDLLGTLEVPADAYYGIHTLRAVGNFPISRTTINDLPTFIRGMVTVKKAAALANQRIGALPQDKAEAIVWACDQIIEHGRCMEQFPVDIFQGGAGTSTNMNTNEVVANLALEHLGIERGRYDVINPMDHVNMAQSTNDAYPTGLRLGLYQEAQGLITAIADLSESFARKGEEFKDVLKMGRTQLQDAVPMTLGQEFTAFAVNLEKEQIRLSQAVDALLAVNMGATAIGTGVNAPAGYHEAIIEALREVTNLPVTGTADLIEATSDQGDYVRVHSAIKRAAMKISKICNDLRLLSSGPRAGLNEINLPARQAGSSIMPGKVNPVIPEVVNQVCFKVFGNDVTVCWAAEAGQLQLNVMEPVLAQCLFSSVDLLTNAADTLRTHCIDGITANPEITREYVERSAGVATFLNPYIGHHEGDRLVQAALVTGKSIRELALERGLLDEAQLDRIFSTENLVHPSQAES